MKTSKPLLLLVTGAPGSGKTTLARLVARRMAMPLLTKDRLKTVLADTLGARNSKESQRLTAVAFTQLYALVAEQLELGISVVVEANLYRGAAEPEIRPFETIACVMQIHCETTFDVSAQRFTARAKDPERHWSFFDHDRIAELARGELPEPWSRAQPLDLPIPILPVETSDGYVPGLNDILEWIERTAPPGVTVVE